MTKRTKVIVVAALGTVALLSVGGYVFYRSQTAESEAARQRQLGRQVPTDGSAVHPGAKAANPPDDPEASRLLDDLERELPAYEAALAAYNNKKSGVEELAALGTSQGKMLPLIQSVREATPRFSPRQRERFRPLNERIQAAVGGATKK